MKHRYVFAGALASGLCGTAPAAVQSLAYTFEPLQCTAYIAFPGPPQWLNCGLTSLSGTFTFDDANADGHIVLDELLGLTVRDTIVVPGPAGPGGQLPRVTAFDYAPATGLSFSADAYRFRVTTGVNYGQYSPDGSSRVEDWIPLTTLRVFAVPEPATAWTLLAGLAALVGLPRRRARTVCGRLRAQQA